MPGGWRERERERERGDLGQDIEDELEEATSTPYAAHEYKGLEGPTVVGGTHVGVRVQGLEGKEEVRDDEQHHPKKTFLPFLRV